MTKCSVSVDLLNLTIETQKEAGVDAAEIHRLIFAFTPDSSSSNPADGIVGFLSADDIPPSYRGEFLTLLLELTPEWSGPPPAPEAPAAARPSWAQVGMIFSRIADAVRNPLRPSPRPVPQDNFGTVRRRSGFFGARPSAALPRMT
jgi:hypothetical protein